MHLSMRPDRVYQKYSDLSPAELCQHGINLLLCDLDYTLAPKSINTADEDVRRWLREMQQAGIQVVILSNNRHPKRVRAFCADLGIGYIGHANKPLFTAKRWERLRKRDRARFTTITPETFRAENTAFLGDKLLTDMLCANLNECWALMVEPLGRPDNWGNHLLCWLQKPWKAMAREKT